MDSKSQALAELFVEHAQSSIFSEFLVVVVVVVVVVVCVCMVCFTHWRQCLFLTRNVCSAVVMFLLLCVMS